MLWETKADLVSETSKKLDNGKNRIFIKYLPFKDKLKI